MALDAVFLAAVRYELAGQITGMKIDKVQQPERDVVIFSLRDYGGNTLKLLICVGSNDKRIHFTNHRHENPGTPPMFCMLLRKYLTGARIINIIQPPAERILIIEVKTSDAMGISAEKSIIIEMIGHMPNIILTDNKGLIIDCQRRISGELSEKRSVLPGLFYRYPPAQERKINPLEVTQTKFNELLIRAGDETIEKWLITMFTALSPLICREIAWRAYSAADYRIKAINDDGAALNDVFFSFVEKIKANEFIPCVIHSENGSLKDYSYTQIKQYENLYKTKTEESFSSLLDNFYTGISKENRMTERSSATVKAVKTIKDRLLRKITLQKSELEEAGNRDEMRKKGDLITANIHMIKKGQSVLITEDYFSGNGEMCEIKLDPLKNPQQNSAKYYKAYTKAKNAQKFLSGQIESGEKEIEYIDSVLRQLKQVESEHELDEIRNELMITGYIKKQNLQKNKKMKQAESTPHEFRSSCGMRIYAGKNNIQNDKLTFKTASRSDLWFHAQKIQGAHIILSCTDGAADDKSIQEAAAVAAYYSASRGGGKISVDYTFVKHVKKPPGSRPGMVIYYDFKTITVSSDEELVKQLRV